MLITGIIHVTGEPDTGKTTFALECGAKAERIWFLDDDVKGRATIQQMMRNGLEFGRYDDLVALAFGKQELQFHEACLHLITDMKPGQFDVVVWDTWSRFAKTCYPYVVANPQQFRRNWSPAGKIKGAEWRQEAMLYEAQILNCLNGLAPTVIVVTHLKDHYINNVRSGKEIPACSKTLVRVPRFRIWLRHNEASPVPVGLVLKRLDRKIETEDGLRTINILPRKITPREGDHSLWDTIGRYFDDPIGLQKPHPNETPDEYELSILDGTLTREQKRTLELVLRAGMVGEPDEETVEGATDQDIALVEQARALKAEGLKLPTIAQRLGVEVAQIATLLGRDTV